MHSRIPTQTNLHTHNTQCNLQQACRYCWRPCIITCHMYTFTRIPWHCVQSSPHHINSMLGFYKTTHTTNINMTCNMSTYLDFLDIVREHDPTRLEITIVLFKYFVMYKKLHVHNHGDTTILYFHRKDVINII